MLVVFVRSKNILYFQNLKIQNLQFENYQFELHIVLKISTV